MLDAARLHLSQPGRVLDQELAAPKGMVMPALIKSMNEHSHCELIHSDFLQHRLAALKAR
jgi:hypothetical protein